MKTGYKKLPTKLCKDEKIQENLKEKRYNTKNYNMKFEEKKKYKRKKNVYTWITCTTFRNNRQNCKKQL